MIPLDDNRKREVAELQAVLSPRIVVRQLPTRLVSRFSTYPA